MRATYIGKGWSSGPNLYLCAKAPKASDTGIWQLTPITRPGTHAGACNSTHLGIESVGDFDRAPPSADQYALLITINLLIMQAWGLPPSSINVHRDCMPGRTCPGKYLTSEQIRADLSTKQPKPASRRYRVRGIPVYEQSDRTGPQWGCLKQDELIEIDDPKNGHLKDGRGFIRLDPDTLEAL